MASVHDSQGTDDLVQEVDVVMWVDSAYGGEPVVEDFRVEPRR